MNILSRLLDILPFKEGRTRRAQAHNLYISLVADARNPATYVACNISDSVDGRFDMIVLHLSLVLKRLKDAGEKNNKQAFELLSKELIGVYNSDMDRNLREMGVGDLSVGKHVKKMAKAFYGRLLAYDQALENNDNDKMQEALSRNIYRGESEPEGVKKMLKYVASYRKHLNGVSAESLIEGMLPNASKTKS